jgi:hypothetical protein
MAGLVVSACASDAGEIVITDARLGRPTGPNAALYLTAANDGPSDRLLGVETDLAAAVEIHETVTETDGTMAMRALTSLELAEGDTLVLEPGGLHLMLVDVARLEVGDTVAVTLVWEKAGPLPIQADVVDPSDTLGDDG